MSPRGRLTTFGSAGVLVAGGIACAVALGGVLAPVLASVLIGMGLLLATSLSFLEVGLSDDRARARETATASAAASRTDGEPRRLRPGPRPGRIRSHRRRLG